jgi:hypothetical protein
MKHTLTLALSILPSLVAAQTLVDMTVSTPRPGINESVDVVLNFSPGGNGTSWCGLAVTFGDGDFREVRVDTIAVRLTKVYTTTGNFAVRAEPRFVQRGLKSAFPCQGSARTASLVVVDPAKEEQARREAEARDKAQRQKEADLKAKEQLLDAQQRARDAEIQRQLAELRAQSEQAKTPRRAPTAAAPAASSGASKDTSLDIFGSH